MRRRRARAACRRQRAARPGADGGPRARRQRAAAPRGRGPRRAACPPAARCVLFVLVPLASCSAVARWCGCPAGPADRYRPRSGWSADPVWFAGPRRPGGRRRTAEVGASVEGWGKWRLVARGPRAALRAAGAHRGRDLETSAARTGSTSPCSSVTSTSTTLGQFRAGAEQLHAALGERARRRPCSSSSPPASAGSRSSPARRAPPGPRPRLRAGRAVHDDRLRRRRPRGRHRRRPAPDRRRRRRRDRRRRGRAPSSRSATTPLGRRAPPPRAPAPAHQPARRRRPPRWTGRRAVRVVGLRVPGAGPQRPGDAVAALEQQPAQRRRARRPARRGRRRCARRRSGVDQQASGRGPTTRFWAISAVRVGPDRVDRGEVAARRRARAGRAGRPARSRR